MTRCTRLGGRGEARRPSTHDDHAPREGGARRRAERPLPAGARVLRARDRGARVVVRDAGVAADAAEDVVEPSLARLARQVRIGDERAGHPDGVAASLADEPIGLGGVDDARRGHERRADAERRGQAGDRVLQHGRGRDDAARAAVGRGGAEGDAHVVDLSGDPADDVLRRLRVGRETNAQRETGGRRAHRLEHGEQEASRLGPLVVAPVEPGREELRGQVLVRGRDLDPVQPGLRRQRGAPRVAFDDLLDLARGQRARLHVEAKAGNRTRARAPAAAAGRRSARGRRGRAARRGASRAPARSRRLARARARSPRGSRPACAASGARKGARPWPRGR